MAPAAAILGYGTGGPDATMPVTRARDRRTTGGNGGAPCYLGSPRAFFSITPRGQARGQGRSSFRSLRSAPAQAPVRVLAGAAAAAAARAAGRTPAPARARVPAGAAAAAGVPVAVPAVPAMAWAAATAAPPGAAAAAVAAVVRDRRWFRWSGPCRFRRFWLRRRGIAGCIADGHYGHAGGLCWHLEMIPRRMPATRCGRGCAWPNRLARWPGVAHWCHAGKGITVYRYGSKPCREGARGCRH